MVWGAIAMGAASIVGGLISSNQSKQAAKGAANLQKASTKDALAEEQRQFDIQMQEYNQKQAQLEQQQGAIITQLAPYVQGGQSALYEMMALSGLSPPGGAVGPPPQIDPWTGQPMQGPPQAATEPGRVGILSGGQQPQQAGFGSLVAAELDKGGRGLTSAAWQGVDPNASPRAMAAHMFSQEKALNPNATTDEIFEAVRQKALAKDQLPYQSPLPTTPNAVNPYAGMTGEQSQAGAVERIASSPLLQELTRQGEEALLQNASATGGLRGGNTQAALAQFRPQMLQQEIDKQYSRLAGLSSGGMSAIGANPLSQPGQVPSNAMIGQRYADIGAINAGGLMGEANATNQAIGSIGRGIGYGIGAYNNMPASSSATGSGGMQIVGYDAYNNPMMQ